MAAAVSGMPATTTVAVYRGVAINGLGDEVDNNTDVEAGLEAVPTTLIERDVEVLDPSTGEPRIIRKVRARPSNPAVDIRQGDRLKDLTTGELYTVDLANRTARTLAGAAGLTL